MHWIQGGNDRDDRLSQGSREGHVSRRDFLKAAGAAGATIGLTGGLGGLLAACGTEAVTTTTGPGATTTQAPTAASTQAADTTTVTAAADAGREIRLGFVEPVTGSLASFGVPTSYCKERWTEFLGDGLVLGDGKKHSVTIIDRDTQSDSNRAAQVTGDLINNDKVDVVMTASTADTVNPVADQAEALATPCVSTDAPRQPYFYGRKGDPVKGFTWTWHAFWGVEDQVSNFLDIWSQVSTNKVVGALWPNDADANAIRPVWTLILKEKGFQLVDGGAYQDGTEDFSSIISAFKAAGTEILIGAVIPPDWPNFWKQSAQQGLKEKVKVATIGKALLFPETLEALGDIGLGLSCEIWWTPNYPFKSSLTGETAAEFAADYEKRTKRQWTQPLMHYIVLEIVVDALRRATNPEDKTAIVEAIKTTKLDTLAGPIDFTAPVKEGTAHPVPNVVKTPMVGGQWVKGSTWPYDVTIVSNAASPTVPVQSKVQPL